MAIGLDPGHAQHDQVWVAAEFGVVMVIYLNHAVARWDAEGRLIDRGALAQAIVEGAVLRVRPKAMTVAVIVAGLLPIMLGSGTGSEVMQRIAAPMIGGMVTAPLLSMVVLPAAYFLLHGRSVRASAGDAGGVTPTGKISVAA